MPVSTCKPSQPEIPCIGQICPWGTHSPHFWHFTCTNSNQHVESSKAAMSSPKPNLRSATDQAKTCFRKTLDRQRLATRPICIHKHVATRPSRPSSLASLLLHCFRHAFFCQRSLSQCLLTRSTSLITDHHGYGARRGLDNRVHQARCTEGKCRQC
jgi:hypothetical protein